MPTINDALARRNALVLASAQGLAGANASVIFATGALVGQALGPSPAWATAPTTTFIIGTALATMPMAYLMRHAGRRTAYMFGAAIGTVAGLIAALAIREGSFILFMVATMLCGIYHAQVSSYRFGATDNASAEFRPKAISWVLLGGLASAFIGPQLVIRTQDLTPPFQYMGSYVGQAVFAALTVGVLALLRAPPAPVLPAGASPAKGRPLREILKNRRLVVAILCAAIAQSMMNLIMTASPLAMIGCFHTATDAALAIQWHIVGMYLPGFFTGPLITRFGVYPVMLLGLALLAACGAVAMMGISVEHFFAALILLGVGWNFAFVGASSLIAEGQRPEERNTIQGFADLTIFAVTAVASLSSGKILAHFGWATLNLTLFPFVIAAAGMVFWLSRSSTRAGQG